MAEIKNYPLNFVFGRALRALNFAFATLACDEVQRDGLTASVVVYG